MGSSCRTATVITSPAPSFPAGSPLLAHLPRVIDVTNLINKMSGGLLTVSLT